MLCALFFLFATFPSLYTISDYNNNYRNSYSHTIVKIFEIFACYADIDHEIVARLIFSAVFGIMGVVLTCFYLAVFILIPVPAYELAN